MQRKRRRTPARDPHANLTNTHYQTYLPPTDQQLLAEMAEARGMAEAAVVREAIRGYLEEWVQRPAPAPVTAPEPEPALVIDDAWAARIRAANEEMARREAARVAQWERVEQQPRKGFFSRLRGKG